MTSTENNMKRTVIMMILAAFSGAPAAAGLPDLQSFGASDVAALAAAAPLPPPPVCVAERAGEDGQYAPVLDVVRSRFRLDKLAVEAGEAEVLRQTAAFKSRVSAEEAAALALRSFLEDFEDPDSPMSLTMQALAVQGAAGQKTSLVDRAGEKLFSMLNGGGAVLRLAAAGEKAGRGEDVSGSWLFSLKVPGFPGYTHWAVVNRQTGSVYNYGSFRGRLSRSHQRFI
ncbi:MAG: hypothetical protein WCK76_04870 [Elusimicrobiota bacterium]